MTNKRDLKAFVRYDGSGRVVAGSLILRRKKPKVGKWTEIQGYQCCNNVTLTYTLSSATITNVALSLYCSSVVNGVSTPTLISKGRTNVNTTTVAGVVTALNNTFSNVGVFSNPSGNIIQLVLSGTQETAICPSGKASFVVAAN
jgi:hypothetical protein